MSNEHYMMSKRCDAERSALYQCSDVDDEINTAIDVRVLKPTTKKHCKGIRHSITGGFWRKIGKYTFWKWWRLVQFFNEATIRRWKEERKKSHLNRPLIYCNRTKRIGDLEFYEANTWANDHIQRRTHINGQELATCRGLYQYTTDLSHKKSRVARSVRGERWWNWWNLEWAGIIQHSKFICSRGNTHVSKHELIAHKSTKILFVVRTDVFQTTDVSLF